MSPETWQAIGGKLRSRYLIRIWLRKLIWYCSGAKESRSSASQYLRTLLRRRRSIYIHPTLSMLHIC